MRGWDGSRAVITLLDPAKTDADMAAGRLRCPGCGRSLSPWGFARQRRVALPGGRWLELTPRRVRCPDCRTTHVLLPAASLPRASASTELVGQVMLAAVGGAGHRSIAADLSLPPSTIRRLLRRLRGNAEPVRCRAISAAYDLDPEFPAVTPRGSPLGDALEALGLAAAAWVRRMGPPPNPWHLLAMMAGGRLLTPPTG